MSQARRDKKPTNYYTIETSRYLFYWAHEMLTAVERLDSRNQDGGISHCPFFRPQREPYANEVQKQTLLQSKCVTYNKNKLNNKGNR